MPRLIDQFPEPAQPRRMKVVVASASRTGTLGLYHALKMLGYKPYHMIEALQNGSTHVNVFNEALRADGLPDVKFIFTERDPDKWVASVNNTAGMIVSAGRSFPMRVLRYFHYDLFSFLRLVDTAYAAIADGTLPEEPGNREVMRRNYVSYVNGVKRVIPADRMCHIRLEDGLGWEQICPYLEVTAPKEPFPRGNEPEAFKALNRDLTMPWVRIAALRLGIVVLSSVAVVALGLRNRDSVLTAVKETTRSLLRF